MVRAMGATDLPAVVGIEREAFSTPWPLDTFEALLDRNEVELLVMEDAREGIVGYAVLWCVLDQGELANIAIRSELRGRGLGARLLGEVLETCKRRGVTSLFLEVRASNGVARTLYERVGFREVGRRRNYYERPREDALVMELVLE